ncbi:MAG: YgjP-like metallopeptidase domain-containing protein, partial [Pseudomonadota bacterium]
MIGALRRRRRAPAPRSTPRPTEIRLDGDGPAVALRWSAGARRLTLSVSHADGRPRLTLPAQATEDEARAFLARQAGWLAEAMERSPPPPLLRPGDALPYGGRQIVLTVEPGPRRAPRVESGRLIVRGAPEAAAAKALAFLKSRARERLLPAAERHAAALG